MHSRVRIIFDGAVGGLLGAGAVALWFLIFDTARGRPLETPALLATVLFHHSTSLAAYSLPRLLTEYSLAHLAAFALIGVAAALLMEAAEHEPPLFLSLLIFFGAFEVFFLALVMFLGPAIMAQVTWWSILVGNLLATAAVLAYFLGRHPVLAGNLFGAWLGVLREGVVAGLIGAGVVALWFLARDAIGGQALRTPALLGAAFFQGLRDPNALSISMAAVAGYTVLHVCAFVAFGLAAAVLMAAAEWQPMLLLGVLVLFACFEVFFLGFVTMIDQSLLQSLGWWTIVVGNILALAAMLAYLLARHRGLRERLVQEWANLELEGGD